MKIDIPVSQPYRVDIAPGLLDDLGRYVSSGTAALVVTEEHVAPLLLERACRALRAAGVRAVPAIAVLIVAALLSVWLSPMLGELAIPVYAYIGVIAAMSALSFLRSRDSLILPIGTVLFVISDAIIAVNKFHTPVPLSGLWIMLTYYAAQAMIALGFIGEQDE